MNAPAPPWAGVVLAGGAGRRMGGRDKPAMTIDGRSLLRIALDAVAGCARVVVVGPVRSPLDGGREVTWTRERPPGGGPAAALAAGVHALAEAGPPAPAGALVAVLAADLPAVTAATVDRLAAALSAGADADGADADRVDADRADAHGGGSPDARADAVDRSGTDGALLVDGAGRPQLVCGVWRLDRLRRAVGEQTDWHGVALRDLLGPLRAVRVAAAGDESADLDTPGDARRWHAR